MAGKCVCYCYDKAQLEVDCDREIVKFTRELPPAHCIIKIRSFSALLEILKHTKRDKYECKEFSAGGYKWSLCIYPQGNKKENGQGHISLYLKLVGNLETSAAVDMSLKFFIFDQIRSKYLTISDIREERFHAMKDERGVPTVLSQREFNDSSNGFLIDDSCVFGVEAFVVSKTFIENGGTGSSIYGLEESELLSELRKLDTFIWKIDSFSGLRKKEEHSPDFTIKGYDWRLILCPAGIGRQRGKKFSIFLCLLNDLSKVAAAGEHNLAAQFEICMKSTVEGKDFKKTIAFSFGKRTTNRGTDQFLPLKELNDPSAGFKVNDSVTIQVTIGAVLLVQNALQWADACLHMLN